MLIQDVVYQPLTPLGVIASLVAVPIIGWLSSKLYDGLKTIIPQYDQLPAIVHQVAAPLFGLAFGWLTAATGAELLTDIHGVSAGFIGAVLNALAMAGIKRWEKSRQPADATVALEVGRKTGVVGTMNASKTRRPRGPNKPAMGNRPLAAESTWPPKGPDSVGRGEPPV